MASVGSAPPSAHSTGFRATVYWLIHGLTSQEARQQREAGIADNPSLLFALWES